MYSVECQQTNEPFARLTHACQALQWSIYAPRGQKAARPSPCTDPLHRPAERPTYSAVGSNRAQLRSDIAICAAICAALRDLQAAVRAAPGFIRTCGRKPPPRSGSLNSPMVTPADTGTLAYGTRQLTFAAADRLEVGGGRVATPS